MFAKTAAVISRFITSRIQRCFTKSWSVDVSYTRYGKKNVLLAFAVRMLTNTGRIFAQSISYSADVTFCLHQIPNTFSVKSKDQNM